MSRMYIVSFENTAITASQDLISIDPATDKPVVIHEIGISQSTETGDAAEEMLRVSIVRGNTTVGSGGTAFSTIPTLGASDDTAGFSARINDTTPASAGTAANLWVASFNVRVGIEKIWTPETRPESSGASFICLRLLANPADSVSTSVYMYIEELG